MPTNKVSSTNLPNLEVILNNFEIHNDYEPYAWIDLTVNMAIGNIDACGAVEVDENNNILAVLGYDSIPSTSTSNIQIAQILLYNLRNTTSNTRVLTIMPAYKYNGEWKVISDASPIKYELEPMGTAKATALAISDSYYSLEANIETVFDISFYTEDGAFTGTLKTIMTDSCNNIVIEKDYVAAVAHNSYTNIRNIVKIADSGIYTISAKAYDDDGKEISVSGEKTLAVKDNSMESYLSTFTIDTSKYGEMEKNNSTNLLPFAPNEVIPIKVSYSNPSNENVAKTFVISRDYECSEILLTQQINIPANGNVDLSYDITAENEAGNDSKKIYLFEQINNGVNIRYTAPKSTTTNLNSIYYRVEIPKMVFSEPPSIPDLHSREGSWMTFYYNNENLGIYNNIGYRMIAYLCDGEKIVDEQSAPLNYISGYPFSLPFEGFDAAAGVYTLKFKLSQRNTNFYEILDTESIPVVYTITLEDPDLMPQNSRIIEDDGENYSFVANSDTLVKGKECKLRYNLENVHSEDFVGKIKVSDAAKTRSANYSIESEEKNITIKANSSEKAYGEIAVTIPVDYPYGACELKLMAKSQYDTDYREIPNCSVTLSLSESSGINDVVLDNGILVSKGKVVIDKSYNVNKINIFDVSGLAVSGYTFSGDTIDFQSLQEGIYIVEIHTDNASVIRVKVVR